VSAIWAEWFSYGWWSDIGVPALGAVGTIAVGVGAIAVAWSSNKVASTIASREHELQERRDTAEERDNRAAFVVIVTRWSDRLSDKIRRPSSVHFRLSSGNDAEPSEVLKAEVDARAAAFRQQKRQDIVAAVESLTVMIPKGNSPDDFRERELIADVRRAYLQSWIAHPMDWMKVDNDARLTAEGWTLAAQFAGRFKDQNRYIDQPDVP
jgi:hypothetical protein